jgi:hypothetical protein
VVNKMVNGMKRKHFAIRRNEHAAHVVPPDLETATGNTRDNVVANLTCRNVGAFPFWGKLTSETVSLLRHWHGKEAFPALWKAPMRQCSAPREAAGSKVLSVP